MYSPHCPIVLRLLSSWSPLPLVHPTDLFRSGSHLERTLRSPITLQKSKFFKSRRRRTTYAIQKISTQREDMPDNKEQTCAKEKGNSNVERNKAETNRDACYQDQSQMSDGCEEPNRSVSRKSESADIARSERGSR